MVTSPRLEAPVRSPVRSTMRSRSLAFFLHVTLDRATLAAEVLLDDRAEAEIFDVVRRMREGGEEAAHPFVLAARARVERVEPLADRVVDAVVVADVEVQEGEVDGRSPVAAVEHARLLHVEGARDDLAVLLRHHP